MTDPSMTTSTHNEPIGLFATINQPSEEAKKRAVLEGHESNHAHVIAWCRRRAVELWTGIVANWPHNKRWPDDDRPYICADHIREVIHEYDGPDTWASFNWMGQVFRPKRFRRIGLTKSLTEGSHNNLLGKYVID